MNMDLVLWPIAARTELSSKERRRIIINDDEAVIEELAVIGWVSRLEEKRHGIFGGATAVETEPTLAVAGRWWQWRVRWN